MPPVSGYCLFSKDGIHCAKQNGHTGAHALTRKVFPRYARVSLQVFPQYTTRNNRNQTLYVVVMDAPDIDAAIESAEAHVKKMLPKSERHRFPVAILVETDQNTFSPLILDGMGQLCRYGEHDKPVTRDIAG